MSKKNNTTDGNELARTNTETEVVKTEDEIILRGAPTLPASFIEKIDTLPESIRDEYDIQIDLQDKSVVIDLNTMIIKEEPAKARLNFIRIR